MHLLEKNSPEAVALLGIYRRVSDRLDNLAGHHGAALDRESTREFLYLSDIAGALESVGGFLNGETKQAADVAALGPCPLCGKPLRDDWHGQAACFCNLPELRPNLTAEEQR